MVRTHDFLYLHEDRYESPTELTKWFVNIVTREAAVGDIVRRLLDVGCATGEVTYQIASQLPDVEVVGCDIDPKLIERARSRVVGCEFVQASVRDQAFVASVGDRFDMAVMKGVHSIFDEPLDAFDTLVRATAASAGNRTVVIAGLFNSFDVDVFVRYRLQEHRKSHREAGWNLISVATVERWLSACEHVDSFMWEKFTPPYEFAPQDDPISGLCQGFRTVSRVDSFG